MAEHFTGISFESQAADALSAQTWQALSQLNEAATSHTYQQYPAILENRYVQQAMGADGLSAFIKRHTAPNAGHSSRNTQQLFRDPMVTLAKNEAGEILSWVYYVNNTSGTDAQAKMDARFPFKRWQNINWIATDPQARRQGLSTACVTLAIAHSDLAQPISAYTWPGDAAHSVLARNGLRATEWRIPLTNDFPTDEKLPTRRYISVLNHRALIASSLVAKPRAKWQSRQLDKNS